MLCSALLVAVFAAAAFHGACGSQVLEAVPTQIVVSPPGSDGPGCGALSSPCRTLRYAARIAPPHSVISVANGTYECGVHVTVALSIVALDSGVVLDCGGVQRAIFFDGVPAHVEGIHFENGYGEGAGCILAVQSAALAHQRSVISRCTFKGCTGVTSPTLLAVAGAVLVYHERVRVPRRFSVTHSTFQGNYARGEAQPAGGMATWMTGPSATSDIQSLGVGQKKGSTCAHFVIDELEPLPSDVGTFAGSYYHLADFSVAGYPTYNSIGRVPTAEDGRVTWAIYCDRTQRYGLVATEGAPPGKLGACDAPITGGPALAGVDLMQYEYWMVRGAFHALLAPQCQDRAASECSQFVTANVPPAQAGRHGLFTAIPGLSVADRPAFAAKDGDDNHFVWYCASLREWVFSDDDPASVDPSAECQRGITSVTTEVVHPALVDGWKHWNNATSQWSVAQPKRLGGLQLICQHSAARCSTYELINAPLDRAATFHELETHQREPTQSNGRPIYASQTAVPTQYLSFCAKYSEWMIHEENPYLHPEEAAICERTFSSTRTQAPVPDVAPNWAIGRGADWEASAVEFVCSDGCASLALWAANAPVPCLHCGDYVRSGTFLGQPMYKQVTAPHHVIVRTYELRQYMVARLSDNGDFSVNDAVLISNDRAASALKVTRWSHVQPPSDGRQPVYTLSCVAMHNCSTVAFEHPDFPKLSGTFLRTARAVNRRASYASSSGATLEFSLEHTAWVVSHPAVSTRVASSATWSVLPTSGCRWDRKLVNGKFKVLATRGQTRCVGTGPARFEVPSSKTGDLVSESHFAGNMALTDAFDRVATAGGLLLFMGSPAVGSVQRGTIRNVTLTKNEAVSHMPGETADAAGGIVVRGADKNSHFVTMSDIHAVSNVGDRGGALAFESVSALINRVTTKSNFAMVKGGGIAGHDSQVNASGWTCAHNHARTVGGCAVMTGASRLSIKNSDLLNGSASSVGGIVDSQGYVSVFASRIDRMSGMALTGSVLSLIDSQLYCGVGRAMTYVGGFGCVHDPAPSLPSGTTTPVVPIDANEAWWIWVANASSMLAQGMLSLTMAVFAIQYCMAHHLANVMPTARQLQASRWRASQRQLQQQQDEKRRR